MLTTLGRGNLLLKIAQLSERGGPMLKNFLSFMSVFFFLFTIVPLGLSSLHWFEGSMDFLSGFSICVPCTLGAVGILFASVGLQGELRLYLVLANSLSIGLYLINIFIVSATA